ncbi:helicase domain-containing protein [Burkholderia pseudomallei]|nr:helicase domain-containing protein [Burkholderia pseudomallei]
MKIVPSLPCLDVQQPGPTVVQLMEAKTEADADCVIRGIPLRLIRSFRHNNSIFRGS